MHSLSCFYATPPYIVLFTHSIPPSHRTDSNPEVLYFHGCLLFLYCKTVSSLSTRSLPSPNIPVLWGMHRRRAQRIRASFCLVRGREQAGKLREAKGGGGGRILIFFDTFLAFFLTLFPSTILCSFYTCTGIILYFQGSSYCSNSDYFSPFPLSLAGSLQTSIPTPGTHLQ